MSGQREVTRYLVWTGVHTLRGEDNRFPAHDARSRPLASAGAVPVGRVMRASPVFEDRVSATIVVVPRIAVRVRAVSASFIPFAERFVIAADFERFALITGLLLRIADREGKLVYEEHLGRQHLANLRGPSPSESLPHPGAETPSMTAMRQLPGGALKLDPASVAGFASPGDGPYKVRIWVTTSTDPDAGLERYQTADGQSPRDPTERSGVCVQDQTTPARLSWGLAPQDAVIDRRQAAIAADVLGRNQTKPPSTWLRFSVLRADQRPAPDLAYEVKN